MDLARQGNSSDKVGTHSLDKFVVAGMANCFLGSGVICDLKEASDTPLDLVYVGTHKDFAASVHSSACIARAAQFSSLSFIAQMV